MLLIKEVGNFLLGIFFSPVGGKKALGLSKDSTVLL